LFRRPVRISLFVGAFVVGKKSISREEGAGFPAHIAVGAMAANNARVVNV